MSTTQELIELLRERALDYALSREHRPLKPTSMLLDQAAAELEAVKAREAKLREPEWFYNADDGEYTYGDVNDTVDDMGYEGVMRVGGAREVWVKWAAVKCVALDPDGEVDETEVHTFDTEAEALRCWPDSLAACRARAALGGEG